MAHKLKYHFILGSSSKFRRELIEKIHITPDLIVSPDINEDQLKKEDPRLYAERIALEKCTAIKKQHPNSMILTADTVISVGTRVLHKPNNIDDARNHLNLLSGRQHRCYTTIVLYTPDKQKEYIRQNLTFVKFKKLHQDEIEYFLNTNEWQGCAGGYTISGYAAGFIKTINGSYSSIVGLPLYETKQLLTQYINN